MFLALREIRFARARFLAMGSAIALLAWLMTLLSGLTSGLVEDGVSGLRALPATHLAFATGADESFSKSTVRPADWEAAAATPGVSAAEPLGNAFLNARTDEGTGFDLALFGVRPGSFLDPTRGGRARLGADPSGVFVSQKVIDDGVRPGQRFHLLNSRVQMRVAGVLDDRSFGHAGVVYAPLALWQQAVYAAAPAGERDGASAIALRARDDTTAAAAATAGRAEAVTVKAAYAASPGYSAETSTMSMIRGFLYVIAAVLVGAFFLVWTIQRTAEIGLLKALGASNRYVLKDALAQAGLLLLGATAVGLLLGVATGVLIEGTAVPFQLQAVPVAGAVALLGVMGLLGVAVSVRRIGRVDPLIALGGAR